MIILETRAEAGEGVGEQSQTVGKWPRLTVRFTGSFISHPSICKKI